MDEPRSDNDLTRPYVAIASGATILHYRVIEKIGAGGMGEVYLAEDTKLGRQVALKFLPAHFANDREIRHRFTREAQAAAKLSHPNVVVIHEVGEFEGRPYFAMEHLEGLSLKQLLRQRKLELSEVTELAIGIADGLQAAHDKKITHRDIKPANIVIDAYGRPKILDFGLASVQGNEQLTRTGSTMGTVQYMSPEQAEGRPVDRRSDLFSLGVMLYELIAGRSPFERESEASTLRAIVSEMPEPIARYRNGVSDDLQRIVTRLLERDPSRRYQTAGDLRSDLSRLINSSQSVVSHPAQVAEKSILVVPLENHGGDPENEYFSDGLTEEIITDLGKITDVTVISRKSSMQLKGTDKDCRTLGRDFGVRYVLTGSVRRAGENIRVNTELVEAESERQLWAERFTGALRDALDIQEEIARSIASALKVSLSASEDSALAQRSIRNPRAYDLYLRARQETERWTGDGLNRAHELLEEALKLEPDSAALYAALGYNYYNQVNLGYHQQESIDKGLEYVKKAFAADTNSVDALRLQGVIAVSLTGQAREGIRMLEQVLEKSPQDTEAMWWLAIAYGFQGRGELGVTVGERLLQIEPFVVLNQASYAMALFLSGDCNRAMTEIQRAFRRDPVNELVQYCRAQIQLYNGMAKEAEEFIRLTASRPALGFFDKLALIQIYSIMGDRAKVDELMDESVRTTARRDIQYPWHLADARANLGDYEEAFEWLGYLVDNGFGNYLYLEKLDPYLEPLRSDERFKQIVAKARANAAS